MTKQDLAALKTFTDTYPNWWYKIGVCGLTRDFDCAPEGNAKESKYISLNNNFDNGFSCDHTGSLADAINQVMADIGEEIKHFQEISE